jgi:hypothetical protein
LSVVCADLARRAGWKPALQRKEEKADLETGGGSKGESRVPLSGYEQQVEIRWIVTSNLDGQVIRSRNLFTYPERPSSVMPLYDEGAFEGLAIQINSVLAGEVFWRLIRRFRRIQRVYPNFAVGYALTFAVGNASVGKDKNAGPRSPPKIVASECAYMKEQNEFPRGRSAINPGQEDSETIAVNLEVSGGAGRRGRRCDNLRGEYKKRAGDPCAQSFGGCHHASVRWKTLRKQRHTQDLPHFTWRRNGSGGAMKKT